MNIEVIIRRLHNEGCLRACASITLDRMIAIHDIKVIQGTERLFVAMPSRKDVDGKYRDIAHPIGHEARQRIESIVFKAYHEALETMGEGSD